MSVYLIGYKINGIKCINRNVELRFYDKTISRENFDITDHNVKGIYGENGSGKSGLVTGIQILKNLVVEKNYLSNDIIQAKLSELINKETNFLNIEIEVISGTKADGFVMIKYAVELKYDFEQLEFYIANENLYERNANSPNNKYHQLYNIVDGIVYIDKLLEENASERALLIDNTKNLLRKRTFLNYITTSKVLEDAQNYENNGVNYILILIEFIIGIDVYLDNEDKHSDYIFRNTAKLDVKYLNMMVEAIKYNNYGSLNSAVAVRKEAYEMFEKDIIQLTRFLQLFKEEIVSIEIDKRENKNRYECNLVINHGKYKVNAEYESTGIKKLIRLFTRFKNVARGGISFIDELDANLHDVYLCRLLEYFMCFTDGQLCFTSHNLGPMEILEKNKNSIDFLSKDGQLESWTKNGNYHANTLYQRGMITNNPFNIDATDFISIFSDESEEV